MNHFIDAWVSSGVWRLGDWSLRWGLLIALVAVWFAVRAPRHAATRDAVWRIVLIAGLAILPTGAGFITLIPSHTLQRGGNSASSVKSASVSQSSPDKSASDPLPKSSVTTSHESDKSAKDSVRAIQPARPAAAAPRFSPGSSRGIITLLAGAWLLGVVSRAFGLRVGRRRLAQLVRAAHAADASSQRLFERCRLETGARAQVTLAVSAAVASPMFVGGRRPCIVVPEDWETLPAPTQRAVLLHELAHVVRGDDYVKLLEEVVRVFFFFHPLVHYLLNRLDSEREEICDVEALRQGVHPRALAQILFDFGRRTAAAPALASNATLPFFRQRTLKERINGLLDFPSSSEASSAPSGRQKGAACLLTLVLLFACRSVMLRAADPAAQQVAAGTASMLEGQLVDLAGQPFKKAKLSAAYWTQLGPPRDGFDGRLLTTSPIADADEQGHFQLPVEHESLTFLLGTPAMFIVITPEGQSYEANLDADVGQLVVHLPTLLSSDVERIEDVAIGELAGVVVNEQGKPLAGVSVNEGYAHKGHETVTNAKGQFRLKGFERDEKVEVIVSKPGYSPETFMQQPTGVGGWVVALSQGTWFEGTVRAPDGRPAAGALVRANQGPKLGSGFRRGELWTECQADDQGRYRLYVQPDTYELAAQASGFGVARLDKRSIGFAKTETVDIDLTPAVTFLAKVVDAGTGKPVAGMKFNHWQNKRVEGTSDADGMISIPDMLPGRFDFSVSCKGYGRWWSEEAVSSWNRYSINKPELNWQRNFDGLDFDLSPGMAPVTIVAEQAVRVRGRVVDPDGNPVAGATAAPALTGTGNSLTGDTRFSVKTTADGTFEMWLPASNEAQYNLMAHDGKYQQWRTWANGVLPAFRTSPGEEIEGVEIQLTRPATVRGRVVDAAGKPVAYRDVRASAADKLENRYYDPTVKTREDGTFELPFIRPGEQYIQAAPCWLVAEQAPPDSSRTLQIEAGQTVEDVELVGHEMR